MPLLELPRELLYCISDCLNTEKDINAFARVDRTLYRLFNEYLYRHNIRQSRSTAILWAAEHGRQETARQLLRHGANIDGQHKYHGNALQVASYRGHVEVARLLVSSGADVNLQGGVYGNPLQAASAGGQEKMAAFLLDHGAQVDACGGFYDTALEAAAARGFQAIVKLLLDNGAGSDMHHLNFGAAFEAALAGGYENIVTLLLKKDSLGLSGSHRAKQILSASKKITFGVMEQNKWASRSDGRSGCVRPLNRN